jgi:predicted N-acetyltransferase YhbS
MREIIRAAKAEEFDSILPTLAAIAYQDRFFNEESVARSGAMILEREGICFPEPKKEEFLEYSGSLSVPFSVLKPQISGAGQSLLSFAKYWQEKKQDFLDEKFKVFVAEIDGQIVGFVKGNFDYVDCTADFPEISELNGQQQICSLGSLYVNPNFRRTQGIGTKLVQKWISELLKEKPDCQGMLTDCYWRNNSQYFFNRMGAESIGFCDIPDSYLDEYLKRQTQNIVGEVMFWTREKLDNLIDIISIIKDQTPKVKKYTRHTLQYSLMTVAKGNMIDFIDLREQNLGITL